MARLKSAIYGGTTGRKAVTKRVSMKPTTTIGKGRHAAPSPPPAPRRAMKPWRPGTVALREVKHYSGSKGTGLLMRRAPFQRLVRSLLQDCAESREADHQLLGEKEGNVEYRMTPSAILCMQEACEGYIVRMLEQAHLAATHAKRVTLMPRDLVLIERINRMQFPNLPFPTRDAENPASYNDGRSYSIEEESAGIYVCRPRGDRASRRGR
jgi:histone H3/H4